MKEFKPFKFITQKDKIRKEKARERARNQYKDYIEGEYQNELKKRIKNKEKYQWGYRAELMALEILPEAVKHNYCDRYHGTDLIYKGFKIDVKTARLNPHVPCSCSWPINIIRQRGIADFYLCILRDDIDKICDIYLVPDSEVNKSQSFAIGNKNKERLEKYRLKTKEYKKEIDKLLKELLK